ncbi:Peroxisomal membrane protein PEX13 [Amphibalanus amphitrite]|uniref:Peroxisomal membrane protein PEX13 n=1 Tax=Amphibalanus amphitrite TaxID=1232801 RepID=A0A6A4W4M1_AMPAM|nr:Peroxisomal membrane protein PEX13 [Amphibalanus amphitrite]
MAAPPKPWESVPPCCRTPAGVNSRMVPPDEMRAVAATVQPQFQSTLAGGAAEPGAVGGMAPPIPPRPAYGAAGMPSAMSPYSAGYGGYSTGYGGYGTGYGTGYGAFGGGYSGYGAGYGGYGSAGGGFYGRPGALGPGPESWFIEAAEESSRSTFESIESFVSVFTSISQMMESTYMLVHSSFRAVVGVAEQMGRMRLHLAELLSALSIARTLRWIVNFLRRWLGYPELEGANAAWRESAGAVQAAGGAAGGSGRGASRWPVLVYLATVLGAPYLIFRLLRANGGRPDNESWKSGAGEHFSAVCSFDFTASGPGELTVRAGQSLRLAPRRLQPRVRGWVLASDGTAAGLVPAAYVKIRGAVPAGGVPGAPAAPAGPGPVPAGPGPIPAGPGLVPAAGIGQAATSAGVCASPASNSVTGVAPAAGVVKKPGGCCGGAAAAQSKPAPAQTEAKPSCCSSKTTTSPADRVVAMKDQLPGNVQVTEVDPATVTVSTLRATDRPAPSDGAQK